MDLSSMINKSGCECLNEADDHVLSHALTSKGGYLESDCDEQVKLFPLFESFWSSHSLSLSIQSGWWTGEVISPFMNNSLSLSFSLSLQFKCDEQVKLSPLLCVLHWFGFFLYIYILFSFPVNCHIIILRIFISV